MCDVNLLIAILVVLIIYLFYTCGSRDYLTSRPNIQQKQIIARDVLANKDLFVNDNMELAKSKLPWIDAITYEDIRQLHRKNKLTDANIESLI